MADNENKEEARTTLVEILEENKAIEIAKYMNFVSDPSAGAVATFSGTTRDTFEGKEVVELRYEAYVPMAVKCLKSICAAARGLWGVTGVAVAHRLGRVGVGETSVFVACASVHRNAALRGCAYIIDELKASVPIWKKEVFANGEVWKENFEFIDRLNSGFIQRKKGCCGAKLMVKADDAEEAEEQQGSSLSVSSIDDEETLL